MIEGDELAELREVMSHFASPDSGDANFVGPESGPANLIGPKVRNLLLWTEQGVYLACIKSDKPVGVQPPRL